MNEFTPQTMTEATTGLRDTECYVFGNGVEIEKVVYAKSTGESEFRTKTKILVRALNIQINSDIEGMDVVKVHFLPRTDLSERANDLQLVSTEEKTKIAIDCLAGFISMSMALKNNQIDIKNHDAEHDFYLYALTDQRFAAFLRTRCGFRGKVPGSQVWIKASEFYSDENITKMHKHLIAFKNRYTPE